MNTLLFAALPVTPGVGLAICGVIAALAVGFLLFNHVNNQPASAPVLGGVASFFSHLKGWHLTPEMQLLGRSLASRLKDFGDATGHKLFDDVILMLSRQKAAPFLPAINDAVSDIEGKLAAAPTATPAPSDSTTPVTLHLPPLDHPQAGALLSFLQALIGQGHAKQPTAKP